MSDMREETEDEISLLDLAITIKENIKLLVLAPIAAGVVALGGQLPHCPHVHGQHQFLATATAARGGCRHAARAGRFGRFGWGCFWPEEPG